MRGIMHDDVGHAGLGQPAGHFLGHLSRVAVHRAIDYHHARLTLIAAQPVNESDDLPYA